MQVWIDQAEKILAEEGIARHHQQPDEGKEQGQVALDPVLVCPALIESLVLNGFYDGRPEKLDNKLFCGRPVV